MGIFYLSNDYLGAFLEVAGFCCQWRDTHYSAWDLIVLEPSSEEGAVFLAATGWHDDLSVLV